jgi:hypothetical protein
VDARTLHVVVAGGSGAQPGDQSPLPARAATIVVALLIGVAAVYRLTGSGHGSDAADPPQPRGFGCAYAGDDDRGYCAKAAKEWARRTQVTQGRMDAVLPNSGKEIDLAASYKAWCGSPTARTCDPSDKPHPPTTADVETARSALVRLGYPGIVVRIARPDDPAPAGALIYAARVGPVCVVGHRETVPGGPGQHTVMGLLPGDRCLED